MVRMRQTFGGQEGVAYQPETRQFRFVLDTLEGSTRGGRFRPTLDLPALRFEVADAGAQNTFPLFQVFQFRGETFPAVLLGGCPVGRCAEVLSTRLLYGLAARFERLQLHIRPVHLSLNRFGSCPVRQQNPFGFLIGGAVFVPGGDRIAGVQIGQQVAGFLDFRDFAAQRSLLLDDVAPLCGKLRRRDGRLPEAAARCSGSFNDDRPTVSASQVL